MTRQGAVARVAARYAAQTVVEVMQGRREAGFFESMMVNFYGGFEIGIGLALVEPDLARQIVDESSHPETVLAIAAAVETLRKSAIS